jgi:uncharacterized membrane protein (UPF0182 family)
VGLGLLGGSLLIVLLKLVDWTAELLWFRALGYGGVFWRLFFAEVAMFAIAFIPVFVYVLLNLLVLVRLAGVAQPNAHRLTPLLIQRLLFSGGCSPASGTDSCAWFGLRISGRPIRSILTTLVSTCSSCRSSTSSQTNLVLLTLSGTLLLGVFYFRIGLLRFDAKKFLAADPSVLRHFIANAVLLLTAWTWGFYLDRFGLLTLSAGAVFGAGYTDVHVLLPGLWVALGATVALICVLVWGAATNALRFAVFGLSATWSFCLLPWRWSLEVFRA